MRLGAKSLENKFLEAEDSCKKFSFRQIFFKDFFRMENVWDGVNPKISLYTDWRMIKEAEREKKNGEKDKGQEAF